MLVQSAFCTDLSLSWLLSVFIDSIRVRFLAKIYLLIVEVIGLSVQVIFIFDITLVILFLIYHLGHIVCNEGIILLSVSSAIFAPIYLPQPPPPRADEQFSFKCTMCSNHVNPLQQATYPGLHVSKDSPKPR